MSDSTCKVYYINDLEGFRVAYVRNSLDHSAARFGLNFVSEDEEGIDVLCYAFDPVKFANDPAPMIARLHKIVLEKGIKHVAVIIGQKQAPPGSENAPQVLGLDSLPCKWVFEKDFISEGMIALPWLKRACNPGEDEGGSVYYMEDLVGFRKGYIQDALFRTAPEFGITFHNMGSVHEEADVLVYAFDPWKLESNPGELKDRLHQFVKDFNIHSVAVIVGAKEPPASSANAAELLGLDALGVEYVVEGDFMEEGKDVTFPFVKEACKQKTSIKPAKR